MNAASTQKAPTPVDAATLLGSLLKRDEPVEPYPYQRRVAKVLAGGRNVIVSAPTGAGKTWSVLLPYLLGRQQGDPSWDRVLYALPLRSLASSLWRSTVEGCRAAGFHVREERRPLGETDTLTVSIQTGEQPLDPDLSGDIIFLTIDQLLATYLNTPLSRPQRLSNVNPGALLGSLIVLDEVHLLDAQAAFGTALDLAARLGGLAQVVVMTATLSSIGRTRLASLLRAEAVTVKADEAGKMDSQRDKQRTWCWSSTPLSAVAVLDRHKGGRSLVLCNSVRRAQAIFTELDRAASVAGNRTTVRLLHSRFYREDRAGVERVLPAAFGPDATTTDEILVATQVVEAGIDISADELHTELCPANGLIQRAGRCARYAVPRNFGTVTVYELERDDGGRRKLGPYRDRENAQLVDLAGASVQSRHQQTLGFEDEQAFLDETLTGHEEALFAGLAGDTHDRQERVGEVIDDGDRSKIRSLIRDVDSVGLLIHQEPQQVRLEDGPELLSVPRTSLFALQDGFASRQRAGAWTAKLPVESKGEDGEVIARWQEAASFDELRGAPWLLALHPDVVRYDERLGLVIGEPGRPPAIRFNTPPSFPRSCYRRESFREHALRTLAVCRAQSASQREAARRLELLLGLPGGTVEAAAEIASALHDTGKLSMGWQDAIWAWQQYKAGLAVRDDELLAHSDYDGVRDWRAAREYARPPHAVEGAYALLPYLMELLPPSVGQKAVLAAKAIVAAVARHHSGHAKQLSSFQLAPGAKREIEHVLQAVGLAPTAAPSDRPSDKLRAEFADRCFVRATTPGERGWFLLYWFIARRLRLADQAATAAHARGGAVAC